LRRPTGGRNSTHWKSLVHTGGKLAYYGENHNLLEVLPKYTNQVASFNAANVWMMNQAADLQEAAGDTTTAVSLRSSADTLTHQPRDGPAPLLCPRRSRSRHVPCPTSVGDSSTEAR
jgi:hypothetical protein